LGACGDVNRNVMAAPLPVADPRYETVRETGRAIADHLLPRSKAYAELWLDGQQVAKVGPGDGAPVEEEPLYGRTYLPRKFKVCVTVAGDNSVDLFTHDLGFAGIFEEDRLVGWNVYAGGGLGRTHRKPKTFPRLADALGFIEPDELLRVAESAVRVVRDHGDRTDRRHARLKYLIHDRGVDWFRSQVEEGAGLTFQPSVPVEWNRSDDRLGWHPQGDGQWFYGLRVENGRVRDDENGALRAPRSSSTRSSPASVSGEAGPRNATAWSPI
jgi:sulfite reductase (ferredoxin)